MGVVGERREEVVGTSRGAVLEAEPPGALLRRSSLQHGLDLVPVLAWTSSADGAFDSVNARWEEYTGAPVEDHVGDRWLERVHPEDRGPAEEAWRRHVAACEPFDLELRLRRADGVYRWFRSQARPVRDGQGRIAGWCGTATDVDDHKATEAALAASEERFRLFFDEAPIGKCMTTPEGRLARVNAAFCAMLGYTADELAALDFAAVTHPADLAESREGVRQMLSGERAAWTVEKRYLAKGGRVVWTRVASRLSRDPAGRPLVFLTHIEDITERKDAEEAARLHQERYRSLFENMLVGVAYCQVLFVDGKAHDFVYLDVNAAFESMTGLVGVRGRRVSEVIPGILEADPGLIETYGRVATTGKAERFEVRVESLNEWFDVAAYSPAQGYFVAVFDVITERKRVEEALRVSERAARGDLVAVSGSFAAQTAELEAVFATMTAAVHVYGRDEVLLRSNPAARALYGFDPIGTDARGLAARLELRRPDGTVPSADELPVARSLRGETVPPEEYVITVADGQVRHVEKSAAPIRVADRLVGAVTVWHDITAAKRAEEALRESQERLRVILETVPVGVVLTQGADGTVAYSNEAFARMLGARVEDIIGRKGASFYADAADRAPLVAELQRRGRLDGAEALYRRADGTPFWAAVWAQRIELQGGPASLGMLMDISEQKRLTGDLQRRSLELEASSREMESFAYSVSHDLRAPLRAIAGFSQALVREHADRLDPTARDYLERSVAATHRMGALIDDLLALSRVTRREMRQGPVDLSALAGEVVDELRTAEASRRMEVVLADGVTAVGDAGLLRLALLNLLGNAWKFSGRALHPRIEFGATEQDGRTVYFVKDNGVGFDMAYADKLFAPFQRLHRVTDFPGTGIGLATVQRIVRRHGGEVWVEARVNEGATFFFTLSRPGGNG